VLSIIRDTADNRVRGVIHAGLYQKKKQRVERKRNISLEPVSICKACDAQLNVPLLIDVQYAVLPERGLGSFKTG
jgi:hypothetical protein